MLYHWHELDPQSASVAGRDTTAEQHRRQVALSFDSAAAVRHARGGAMRIHSFTAAADAANDADPDANVPRLRSAGVGVADYRIRLAQTRITHRSRRFMAVYGMRAMRWLSGAIGLFGFVAARPTERLTSCSHTMVSNDQDDQTRVYNGA